MAFDHGYRLLFKLQNAPEQTSGDLQPVRHAGVTLSSLPDPDLDEGIA
jgi:hypothetical protein